jgi:hypothetical protein
MAYFTNCPNCGAVRDLEATRCPYCDTPYLKNGVPDAPPVTVKFDADAVARLTQALDLGLITPNEARRRMGL